MGGCQRPWSCSLCDLQNPRACQLGPSAGGRGREGQRAGHKGAPGPPVCADKNHVPEPTSPLHKERFWKETETQKQSSPGCEGSEQEGAGTEDAFSKCLSHLNRLIHTGN